MKTTPTFVEIHQEYQRGNDQIREQYQKKLKAVVLNQSEDKLALAEIFAAIANYTLEIAETAIPELKLYYYNDAAATCHYVLQLAAKDKENQAFKPLEQQAYSALDFIQENMVELGRNTNKLNPISGQADIYTFCHREQLQALRDLTKESLEQIETYKEAKEKYISKSADLFKTIASGMEKYLAGLYTKAGSILGDAPCKYAVIGLGSMALKQMTPYSDLECAILTENEEYKQSDNPKESNYFKNLSHLVNFMLINLGETIIPTSRFGFDLSEFIPQAVNFDLGGKTPLGRIEQDKPYELVQTVDGLLKYMKNVEQKSEHIDKSLPNILQKSCFVYGNRSLQEDYQRQTENFLNEKKLEDGRSNGEVRAVHVLLEGVVEKEYAKSPIPSKKIEGALQQFTFNATESEGKLFDVKQEIYRLPDRLIYNLGLIYGIQGESSWDTIDELSKLREVVPNKTFRIISEEGAANLKKALTFATNLRLKTYDHYGYQKETMDFSKAYNKDISEAEKLKEAFSKTFQLSNNDLTPGGALFEYYKIVLPLHQKLKDFCERKDIEQKEEFFANEEFNSNNPGIMAKIHLRLLQYQEALDYQRVELQNLKEQHKEKHVDIAHALSDMGLIYNLLGQPRLALECHLETFETEKSIKDEAQLVIKRLENSVLVMASINIPITLVNIGMSYNELGNYNLALKYLQQALFFGKHFFGEEHAHVATILNNIGTVYHRSDQYDLSLGYRLQALELRKKSLGDDHPDIAISLKEVGNAYKNFGQYKLALKHLLRALELNIKCFGEDHPYVAATLSDIGIAYSEEGQHKLAFNYLQQALKMREKCCGEEHFSVALSLGAIGNAYKRMHQYKEALKCALQALELNKKWFGVEHADVAANLNSVGVLYDHLKEFKLALKYKLDALTIMRKCFGGNHPHMACILNNLGEMYVTLNQYKLAVQYNGEALSITKKYLGEDHPNLAMILNNTSTIYSDFGNYEKALEYQVQALAISMHWLSTNHPSVIIYRQNIAALYSKLGDYDTALKELKGMYKDLSNARCGVEELTKCAILIKVFHYDQTKFEEGRKYLAESEEYLKGIGKVSKLQYNKALSALEKALVSFKSLEGGEAEFKQLRTLELFVKVYKGLNNKKNNKSLASIEQQHKELSTKLEDRKNKLKEIEEYFAIQILQEEEQKLEDLAVITINDFLKSFEFAATEPIPLTTSLGNGLRESVELNNPNQPTLQISSTSLGFIFDKLLSEGFIDIQVQETNLILHKKEDEVIIKWFDFTNFLETSEGKIILEAFANKAVDSGMTLTEGNNTCLNFLNQACYEATQNNLPTKWFINFLDYIELSGVTGPPDSGNF